MIIDSYPLTPMQFGMVYDSLSSDRPGVNIEQVVVRLEHEDVDLGRLRQAFEAVVDRHPVLRTSVDLTAADGGPRQDVHDTMDLPWTVFDWSGSRHDVETALADLLQQDRQRSIDVSVEPPTRLNVATVAGGAIVVWTLHHALVDGRSIQLLLNEVFDRYDGRGRANPDPTQDDDSDVRFADHVAAVVAGLADGRNIEHFAPVLAGIGEPSGLVSPAPVEVDELLAPAVEPVVVATDVVDRLVRWAHANDVTIGTLILAAWAIVLGRHTGRVDVLFGATRAGRQSGQFAGVAGCFITTVPMRATVDRATTLRHLVDQLRSQQISVRPYEHTSLADLGGLVDVAPSELLPSVIVFERESLADAMRAKGGDWARRSVELHERPSVPVLVAAYQTDSGLELHVDLDERVHPPIAKRQIGNRLAAVLQGIAEADPTAKVDSLPLLSEAELQRLHTNHVTVAPSVETSIIDQIYATAAGTPSAVAVRDLGTGEHLTYRELMTRAERLARVLIANGAHPNDPIALHVSRSVGYVVAVVAVLAAGAPFLPIDPDYSASHVDRILADSGATIVVTEVDGPHPRPSSLRSGLRSIDVDAKVEIDAEVGDDTPGSGATMADRAAAPPRPDDIAYLIFTSGSTGQPNGVEVTFGGLADYAAAIIDRYELASTDRVLQFASLGFDISIEEIIPTLVVGAQVMLRSQAMVESLAEFVTAAETHQISVLNLPTAFWHELVEFVRAEPPTGFAAVRLMIVGGERASRSSFDRWTEQMPGVRWMNAFGLTETTVTSTVYERGVALVADAEIPIGRPLANSTAYILDDQHQLVAEGEVGMLWIGGTGVARGYRGRPSLTATRFQADPFIGSSSAVAPMMYRTGDLARWLPSGNLAFLGRADRQVKLRGHRIELDGIAATLESAPAIANAAVDVRSDAAGNEFLVAWVVTYPDPEWSMVRLREHLRARLPEAMIPPRIRIVDRLPTTPGGKLDVSKLTLPEAEAEAVSREGPLTPDALEVAEVVANVLGVGEVGVDRSFFDLGGNSLLALRLIVQLGARWEYRLTLAELHREPTARAVAARIGGDRSGIGGPNELPPVEDMPYLVEIQPHGDRPPVFGVHMIGTNGEFFRPLAARLGLDQPLFGVSLSDDGLAAAVSVEAVADRYATAIADRAPFGPVVVAAFCAGASYAVATTHELLSRGREVGAIVLFDAVGPARGERLSGRIRLLAHYRALRSSGLTYARWSMANPIRDRYRDAQISLLSVLQRPLPDALRGHRFGLLSDRLAAGYVPPPFNGPVGVFYPELQVLYSSGFVSGGLGWRGVAAGELDIERLPGGHLTMLAEPAAATTAVALRKFIERHVVARPPRLREDGPHILETALEAADQARPGPLRR